MTLPDGLHDEPASLVMKMVFSGFRLTQTHLHTNNSQMVSLMGN